MNAALLLAHYARIADAPDAIARLRRFVMDLAVRGKLVEQDASDEPASELLKQIAAERARLAKSGEAQKSKDLPLTVDDADFDLPETWLWTRLGSITSYIQRGKSPKYAEAAGAPVISQKCVQWAGLNLAAARLIMRQSLSGYEEIRFIRDGDLLWNSTGTGTIGRIVKVEEPSGSLVCDSHVTIVRCLKVNPEFVRTWLRSDHVYGSIEGRAAGSTNQVELTAQMAINQVVPLPPLAEQHRIVAKVDELMALCDQLEAARAEREAARDTFRLSTLAKLNTPDPKTFSEDAHFALANLAPLTTRADQIKQLRQTILNLAVRGKLEEQNANDEAASEFLERIREWQRLGIASKVIRAPRKPLSPVEQEDHPYAKPDGWCFARLGEIIYIQSGDGLTAANMKGDCVPVFGGNGINGYHDCGNVSQPTVVIGRVGYYCGSIHITPDVAWVTDNAFITHFSSANIFIDFLVLLLKGTNLKEDENATAQPVISGSKIYPIVVGLPPVAEQRRIVAKFNELMALCDQLEASLTTGEQTRSRLLEAVLHNALEPA